MTDAGMTDALMTMRLAHLHLRTGLPALARVELEALAGRGTLSAAALADLAEARWRAGELASAGEAAQAHLDQGGDQLLAEVVVIEALAAAGRHRDARRLASRLLGRDGVDDAALDRVFAGRPRSAAWPDRRAAPVTMVVAGSEDDLTAADAALGRGDPLAAAGLLAVILREEPALAAMVLSLAERGLAPPGSVGPAAAAMLLVRGDALRLLGRTTEASAAFQGSRRAVVDAAPREEPT